MSAREATSILEHIRAHPEDDAPRLVYADWLDEHGDAGRAEFIRVQCERARMPEWDARHLALGFREKVLLDKHARRWRKEVPALKGVTWTEFRRGFPGAVEFTTFAALVANATAVWAAAPVEAVTVRWPRREDRAETAGPIAGLRELTVVGTVVDMPGVDQLADCPLLSTLRALTVREASLGAEGFRRLVASALLGRLTALRTPFNSIGNGGIRALVAHAKLLPALAELDLSETGSYGRYGEDPIIDTEGLEELAAWKGLARLHTLALSGNDFRRGGLRVLLRSPNVSALRRLTLRENALDGAAMQEFVRARPGLELESLDLGENLIGDTGAGHLAKAACLRGLKVLNLDACEVFPPGVRQLAKAPFLAELRVLEANNNYLGRDGLEALLAARPAHLHTLRIAGNDLEDAGAALLAGSPATEPVLSLDLAGNRLSDRAAIELARSAHLPNLLGLTLTGNAVSPAGVTALRRSPVGKRLAQLDEPVRHLTPRAPPAPPGEGNDIPF